MNIDERIEQLKMLMPTIKEEIILFLAADNPFKPWADQERRKVFHEPMMEFFRKFRIDRKKLQRIMHYCGEAGAKELTNSYWHWSCESNKGEATDMATVAGVGRAVNAGIQQTSSVEEVTDTANRVLTADGKRDPFLKLDATRCALIIRCDTLLERAGKYRGISTQRCHRMLRGLVRKCEMDSQRRPPEWWLFPETRQKRNPNAVYADGKFGDGSEYYKVLDEDGRIVSQGRRPAMDPLVPEFLGLSRQEQQMLVNKLRQDQVSKKKHTDSDDG